MLYIRRNNVPNGMKSEGLGRDLNASGSKCQYAYLNINLTM